MRDKKILFLITMFLVVILLSGVFLIQYLEKRRNLELVEKITSLELFDINVIKIAKLKNWKPEDCLVINKRENVEAFMEVFKQVKPGGIDDEETIAVERFVIIDTDYGTRTYLATIYETAPEKIIITQDIYKVKRHSNYNLKFSGKEVSLNNQSNWFLDLLRSNNCLAR